MAQAERIRKKCQNLLDETFGKVAPGKSSVKWEQITNLFTISPVLEADGDTPKFIPVCACGRNISVHSASCALTRLELQVERYYFPIAYLDNKGQRQNLRDLGSEIWVLVKWVMPPSPEEWMLMDPDLETYPSEGTYEPVSANGMVIWVKGPFPTPGMTKLVVSQFKQFWAQRKQIEQALEEQARAKDWTPPKDERGRFITSEKGPSGNHYHRFRDQFRDQMTLNGHIPGTKQGVTYQTPQFMQSHPMPSQDVHGAEKLIVLARD